MDFEFEFNTYNLHKWSQDPFKKGTPGYQRAPFQKCECWSKYIHISEMTLKYLLERERRISARTFSINYYLDTNKLTYCVCVMILWSTTLEKGTPNISAHLFEKMLLYSIELPYWVYVMNTKATTFRQLSTRERWIAARTSSNFYYISSMRLE